MKRIKIDTDEYAFVDDEDFEDLLQITDKVKALEELITDIKRFRL